MGFGVWGKIVWVAVKELKLSYYIGETLLFTIYIYTPNIVTEFKFLNSNPVVLRVWDIGFRVWVIDAQTGSTSPIPA